LAGVAAALTLAVIFFDWNWFRPMVEQRASAGVGRPVHIQNLSVHLSRFPLVVLDGVTVDNPEDFPAGSKMATAERIAVRVDLMSLLKGEVVLPELIIDRPTARLEPGSSGKQNWEIKKDDSAVVGTPPEIGQLTINDGRIHVRDPGQKTEVDLAIHTEADEKGGEAKLIITGTGKYAEAPTRIDLRAGSLLALRLAEVRYPINLKWEVGPTRITLNGTVDNPTSFAGLQGTLDLRGPDLAKLYPLIGIPLPPSPPYHLSGKITYADKHARFEGFTGTLGESDLSGTLDVQIREPRNLVQGDLTSKRIRLVDLAGFLGGVPGEAKAANASAEHKARKARAEANDRALPTVPIDVEKLNAIDAHVTYRGLRIESEYMPLDNLQAKLDLDDGKLRLEPLTFGIGKGDIKMTVALDSRARPPRISVDTAFRNVDLHRIMQQTKIFEGTGRIGGRAKLVSSGNNTAEIMARGDGDMTLVMTGGQMSALLVELVGIDLAEALGIEAADNTKQYPIRCMVFDSAMQKGVLSTKTFVIDTTDTNITASASVNFQDESLKARLEPHPKDVSILTFRTPVNVGGTLKHPTVSPDAAITGGRIAAMIGLGIVATPLAALIPTIELGLGEDSDCKGLIQQARVGKGSKVPSKTD